MSAVTKDSPYPYRGVGARLAKLAAASGYNGADIVRLSGGTIRPSRWSEYLKGERLITVEAAVAVIRITGATLDYIYMGNPSGLPKRLTDHPGFIAA